MDTRAAGHPACSLRLNPNVRLEISGASQAGAQVFKGFQILILNSLLTRHSRAVLAYEFVVQLFRGLPKYNSNQCADTGY